jgi:hypothetical protein
MGILQMSRKSGLAVDESAKNASTSLSPRGGIERIERGARLLCLVVAQHADCRSLVGEHPGARRLLAGQHQVQALATTVSLGQRHAVLAADHLHRDADAHGYLGARVASRRASPTRQASCSDGRPAS